MGFFFRLNRKNKYVIHLFNINILLKKKKKRYKLYSYLLEIFYSIMYIEYRNFSEFDILITNHLISTIYLCNSPKMYLL